MIIINGENAILGRLASFVAKKAMLGEKVVVLNSAKIVISGAREEVFAKFERMRNMGTHSTGPFIHRYPEKLVKRSIRGMIPYKQAKGRTALENIKCYRYIPEQFKDKEMLIIKDIQYTKLPNLKFVRLEEVSRKMGAKI